MICRHFMRIVNTYDELPLRFDDENQERSDEEGAGATFGALRAMIYVRGWADLSAYCEKTYGTPL